MPAKETIVISEDDKEVLDFLERLRLAGSVSVQIGAETYDLRMTTKSIKQSGRDFLAQGGPSTEDDL